MDQKAVKHELNSSSCLYWARRCLEQRLTNPCRTGHAFQEVNDLSRRSNDLTWWPCGTGTACYLILSTVKRSLQSVHFKDWSELEGLVLKIDLASMCNVCSQFKDSNDQTDSLARREQCKAVSLTWSHDRKDKTQVNQSVKQRGGKARRVQNQLA